MSAAALHPAVVEAYGVLATGTPIELPLATRLSELPGEDVLDLISLAHKVRLKYAPGLHACSIVNAKSGACPENCRFCAQSAHHAAQVPEYGLLDPGGAALPGGGGLAQRGAPFRHRDRRDRLHRQRTGRCVPSSRRST